MMKKLPYLLPLLALLACGKQSAEETMDFSNITFEIDTVVVDPGEEIINLRSGLWSSVFNEDNSKLFLFDQQATVLDIIDLNQLVLKEKVPFQKEGPNGTGSYVSWMALLDEARILMANFEDMALFDLKGNKLRTYDIRKGGFEGEELPEGSSFYRKSVIAADGHAIYGMMGNWMNEKETFSKIDFQQNQVKHIELPGKESLSDYSVMLKAENMITVMGSDKTVQRVGSRLIISNSGYTNLFVVDMANDSAYQVDYTPKLTAKAKKGGYPTEVESEKRFKEVMEQIHAEINFQAPIWDAKNKRFYRFSYETTPTGNTEGPLFQSAENRPTSKVYISVLDENFNLLGESLTELRYTPGYSFVKDGLIWSYVNVDDELGFVRLKMD